MPIIIRLHFRRSTPGNTAHRLRMLSAASASIFVFYRKIVVKSTPGWRHRPRYGRSSVGETPPLGARKNHENAIGVRVRATGLGLLGCSNRRRRGGNLWSGNWGVDCRSRLPRLFTEGARHFAQHSVAVLLTAAVECEDELLGRLRVLIHRLDSEAELVRISPKQTTCGWSGQRHSDERNGRSRAGN